MADLGQAYVQIVPSAKGIAGSIESILDPEARKAGTSAGSTTMESIGKGMTKAGAKYTALISTPIATALGGAIKIASDFDTAMSQVAAVSGATGDDLASLRDLAREMGATTKFSASEAAEGLNYMAMAGWDTTQMMNGLPGILDLAAASGEELGITSDIVTDALTAFGMKAEEAGHFADILAAASSNSNTNVSMLGESFKYVAPVAGALGYSAEDTSIALGLMANSGIKASQAGTTLRTIISNMTNPTDEMAKAMDALGVSLDDGHGNMYSLKEIMDQMRVGMGNLMISEEEYQECLETQNKLLEDGTITEKQYMEAMEDLAASAFGAEGAEKAKAAAMLAGSRGMSGLLAITSATAEDYDKLTESIYGCEGAAKTMAEIMQDNLGGQLTKLKSATQELGISFGELMIPTISNIVSWIQSVIDKLNALDPRTKDLIIKIGLVVAAVGPALLIGGKLISSFKLIKESISSVSTIMTMFTGPVGIVIAAIGAAIAVGVLLYENWDTICEWANKLKESIVDAWETVKNKVTEFATGIKGTFDNVKQTITGAWDSLKQNTATAWDHIRNTIDQNGGGIQGVLTTAMQAYQSIWSTGLSYLDQITGGRLSNVGSWFINTFQNIWNFISNIAQKIAGIFNFQWKLPNIQLPHFSIVWNDLGHGVKLPSISVQWYKSGGIFDSPSLIGVGEAGREAVVPLEGSAMRPFAQTIAEEMAGGHGRNEYQLLSQLYDLLGVWLPQMAQMQLVTDTGALVGELAAPMDRELAKLQNQRGRMR